MDSDKALFTLADPTEHAIVGSDKKLPGAFNYDPSARGSNAWVDDCHMNSTGGKFPVYGEKIKRGSSNILGRNFVGYVYDASIGVDREYGALHRADEIILRAKISQESNDSHDRRSPQRHEVTKLISHQVTS